MEIKYQQKTLVYSSKERTYNKVKQFVLQQIPELKQKKWTFTYFDCQCDQVIIGDEEDFESTVDYYKSIQKDLVLIVKQMWWKTKKVHSRSRLVKQLLARKSFQNDDFKVQAYNLSDSDSDDDFINIDLKAGQIYVDDSQEHFEEENIEKTQVNTKNLQSCKKGEANGYSQHQPNEEKEETVAFKNKSQVLESSE